MILVFQLPSVRSMPNKKIPLSLPPGWSDDFLGSTAPRRSPSLSYPPNWGDDPMSYFIDAALKDAFVTFTDNKFLYARINYIECIFLTACNGIADMSNATAKIATARTLMGRAHSGYRVACQLIMQGQIAESFPVLRVCLEYSLYAMHIKETPWALAVWLDRDKDALSKNCMRTEFLISNVKSTLGKINPELYNDVNILYEACISLGAHPNPQGVENSVDIISTANRDVISIKYQHDDPNIVGDTMIDAAEIGLASLRIFEHIFPKKFACLGLSAAIEFSTSSLNAVKND